MDLTIDKINELKSRHKKERDKRICDRIKAVLLINQGYAYQEVAEILLVDDDTVRRHIQEYCDSEKLINNNKGSDSKLNHEQTAELIEHLRLNTFTDVRPIMAFVKNKYQINYVKSGMTAWLKEHSFSYKKPKLVPVKYNAQKQEEFIQVLNTLQEQPNPLYFLDAVHPEHQTRATHGWFYKGDEKSIKTTATQKRVHIFGALAYPSNDLVIVEDTTINSQTVVAMLEKLKFRHTSGAVINCVLDNAKYQKNHVIQDYIKDNPNLQLHFLPAYSPNLNLIERLWKFMHKHVTNNFYYDNFDSFKYSVLSFLKNIDNFKNELKSLLSFKFQKLNYAPVNFVK